MKRSLLLCLLASLTLAGCANDPARPGADNPKTVTQKINLSAYPPEFRKGFSEGCNAAKAKAPAAKPKQPGQFADGWSDGYAYCKG